MGVLVPPGMDGSTTHQATAQHAHHHDDAATGDGLWSQATRATLHCLLGCATGEVLGLVIGTALGLSTLSTIVLAVGLAFLFGYAFTLTPVLRTGMSLKAALAVTLAADTVSITVMEVGAHVRRYGVGYRVVLAVIATSTTR